MKGSSYRQLRAALFVHRWLNPIAEVVSKNVFPSSRLVSSEMIYQGIMHRELARLEIERPFYPVRSAATSSYLYLLIRICTKLPVRSVLELGCGQSTLLLKELCRVKHLDIISLEHDQDWAKLIGAQCEHVRLNRRPLERRRLAGADTDVYDFDAAERRDAEAPRRAAR